MEIHRADPVYRKRALLVLLLSALLCVGLLLALHHWLLQVHAQLLASDIETMRHRLRGLLAGLGLALALPTVLLVVWLDKLALASRAEGRFPPRGLKTLRDVRTLPGADALRWAGRVGIAGHFARGLAVAMLACAAWCWWRFS